MKAAIKVAPSMMCADFLNLGAQLSLLEDKGVDYLHIDIMDGHYVPNFSLGPDFCRRLCEHSNVPLDIHLMVERPESFVPLFASFGHPALYIHPETSYHPVRCLELIKSCGARPGLAIDPALPLEAVRCLLPYVELACIMTVNPGYAGQELLPHMIAKLGKLAEMVAAEGYPIEIEVDGNVSWRNIPLMIEAGARILVAGSSSLFEAGGDLADNLERLYGMIGRG